MLRNRSNIQAEIKGSGIGFELRRGSLFSLRNMGSIVQKSQAIDVPVIFIYGTFSMSGQLDNMEWCRRNKLERGF